MGLIPPRLLLEGRPGVGKTTVALRLIEILQADGLPVTGFVTREVRGEGGRWLGFEIETVDGRHGLLADVDLRGGPRVGRYGVALEDHERLCVPLLEHAHGGSIVVVDELGKMLGVVRAFRGRGGCVPHLPAPEGESEIWRRAQRLKCQPVRAGHRPPRSGALEEASTARKLARPFRRDFCVRLLRGACACGVSAPSALAGVVPERWLRLTCIAKSFSVSGHR